LIFRASTVELKASPKFEAMRQRMRDIVEQDVALQNALVERGSWRGGTTRCSGKSHRSRPPQGLMLPATR